MSDIFSPRAQARIDELEAELAELRAEMKRRTEATAARTQMDGEEIARLRESNAELEVMFLDEQKENDRLREGHRICEENMDAEIDRLREIVERYERDYGRYPEVR